MKARNEYRVNAEGSYQGNYVLAYSPSEAKAILRHKYPNEKLEVHLWKTVKKGKIYPDKLTSYAKRKMRLVT